MIELVENRYVCTFSFTGGAPLHLDIVKRLAPEAVDLFLSKDMKGTVACPQFVADFELIRTLRFADGCAQEYTVEIKTTIGRRVSLRVRVVENRSFFHADRRITTRFRAHVVN